MIDIIAAVFIMFGVLWLGFAALDVGWYFLVFALLVRVCGCVAWWLFGCLFA